MLSEVWSSLQENLKTRSTNPLLGTIALLFLLKHWVLLYALCTFEANWKLPDRIQFISYYIQTHNIHLSLIEATYEAIIILVLTYSLLNLSRLIINFFENQVTPRVYKLTNENSIVLRTEYDRIQKLLAQARNDLADEIRRRVDTEKLVANSTPPKPLPTKSASIEPNNIKSVENFENLSKSKIDELVALDNLALEIIHSFEDGGGSELDLLNELNRVKVNKEEEFRISSGLTKFIVDNELAKFTHQITPGVYHLEITPLGKSVSSILEEKNKKPLAFA